MRAAARGLAGAALLIAGITVASRVIGFVRALVLAAAVGPNALGSAYTSANVVPNVLFEIAVGGALAGAVVPLLAAPLAAGLRRDVDRIASALLGWTAVVLVPVAGLMAALAGPLAAALVPGADQATLAVTAGFLRVFAVQVPLYGVAVVLFGVLQAHRRFAWPALAPLLNNLVVIAVLVWFARLAPGPKGDPGAVAGTALAVLAWGTTAGVATMAASVVVPAWRTGLRVRPTLDFGPGVGSRARALLLAGLGAVVAQQVSVLATVWVANRWGGPGTYLVVQFLQQVYLLPYAVLAYPLVTAAFPRLAERAAQDDHAGFARLAASTTRTLLAVAAAGAAVLAAAAGGVAVFYARVADGPVDGVGPGLAWLAPGLVGFVLAFHASRALYGLHRGRSAGLALGAGWVAVAVASPVLAAVLVTGTDQRTTLIALGAASSVGMTIGGGLALVALGRAAGPAALAGLVRTALVVVPGAVAGGVLGHLAGRAVGDLGAGVVAAAVGAVVALAVLAVAVAVGDRSVLTAVRPGRD